MKRRTNDQWRRDVFASRDARMTSAVKVLLIYMADHMKTDGQVSIPRDAIAKDLGIHKARVAERLAKAIDADYLTRVQAGYPGCTAIYRRLWPDECVQQSGIHMGTAPPDALSSRSAGRTGDGVKRGMVTAPRDAIDTEPLSVWSLSGTVRDEERSEEKASRQADVDHRRRSAHDREETA
ncbi:helix-turn-helix domain-containing protein [Nocardioides sp.]|uniref:helix-turn-helix domain-containing protein n=1 Tax=Nocardioides sp. TaxID=35761 RepID=UPI002C4D3123|nr:helix-turn-helix domain-containing protein [Nocardioides sp.]HXH78178.1 helix-turn-helix domain-containing protein [Nocardioides sp.]